MSLPPSVSVAAAAVTFPRHTPFTCSVPSTPDPAAPLLDKRTCLPSTGVLLNDSVQVGTRYCCAQNGRRNLAQPWGIGFGALSCAAAKRLRTKASASAVQRGRRIHIRVNSMRNVEADPYLLDASGVTKMPRLVDVPPEVAKVVASFAEEFGNTPAAPMITGQRIQVYMEGVGSEPFAEYVRAHEYCGIVMGFLHDLKGRLLDVAKSNGGQLSRDILVLVGSGEMQVPHIDLLKGQVQIILAVAQTQPTLVYDPSAEVPSLRDVANHLEIDPESLRADAGLTMLVEGGAPLVLPVPQVYDRMVHACTELGAGDAVQIRDGIVHAGPRCEEKPGVPRMVIFSTYTTRQTEQYDVGCQVKLWDWASHPAVPASVAYRRLRDVYEFGHKNGLDIRPWSYCPPDRAEACKMLCVTPDLELGRARDLVDQWRGS